MNLRRIGLRLALGLAALWFVFWTFAYVIHPYSSLRREPEAGLGRAAAASVVIPCLLTGLAFGVWIAAALRAD